MSDVFVRVIHPDPTFIPSVDARERALTVLKKMCPRADLITDKIHDKIVFVDAGSNYEKILCPLCANAIDHSWWADKMERASAEEYRDLTIKTPCCGKVSTLNDLKYICDQGFARYVLEVRNPGIGNDMFREVLDAVRTALGYDPRVIWARI